jgi:hypothetical protein
VLILLDKIDTVIYSIIREIIIEIMYVEINKQLVLKSKRLNRCFEDKYGVKD